MKDLQIQKDKDLTYLNSYFIESKAKYYHEYRDIKSLKKVIKWAKKKNIKIYILGGGSNILILHKKVDGMVIHINKRRIQFNKNIVEVSAGVDSSLFAVHSYYNSFKNAEFLYGLPGKIGGAIYMNARAYKNSISQIIKSVKVIDLRGNILNLTNKDMKFDYKDSIFQHKNLIILEAKFQLKKGNKKNIKKKMNYNLNQRIEKGHFDFPSCGSVFKNPYNIGIPAGKLIDDLGLKGTKIGDAQIYKKHGNFIVNKDNANGNDIYKLIKLIKRELKEKSNIYLEEEVNIW